MQVNFGFQVIEATKVSLGTDMHDSSCHLSDLSLYSTDHFAAGPHLPLSKPDQSDLKRTPSSAHLAAIPLPRAGAPRPDVKPQGPRPQPVKRTHKDSVESVQAPKFDATSTLKSDIPTIPKSDPPKFTKSKAPEPTPKSSAPEKAKFTPASVPGIYGKQRFPCSRPKFIYAYGYNGDRWAHLPDDRRPTETKAEDYKPQLKSSKALIRALLLGDPVRLGVCILKPRKGKEVDIKKELGMEEKKESAVNDMGSVFAAASNEKEKGIGNPSVTAILGGTAVGSTSGSGSSGEEPTDVRDEAPPGSAGSVSIFLQASSTKFRLPSPLLGDTLDSDIELIDLEAEPEIRQLCFPAPRVRRGASPPSPLDLRLHLNRALVNFRALYSVGSALSASLERSDSVESQGLVTPIGDEFVIIPMPESKCGHGERGSSIPMGNRWAVGISDREVDVHGRDPNL